VSEVANSGLGDHINHLSAKGVSTKCCCEPSRIYPCIRSMIINQMRDNDDLSVGRGTWEFVAPLP
jgi:hypothetical protein